MYSWLTDPQTNAEILRAAYSDFLLNLIVGLAAMLVVGIFARRGRRKREAPVANHIRTQKILGNPLPAGAELLSMLGSNRTAPVSIDTHIMRSTYGVRLLTLGVLGAMCWYVIGPGLDSGSENGMTVIRAPFMEYSTLAIAFVALVTVWSYELRWNRDEIILTRFLYPKKTARWRDLVAIRDNKHHEYILDFGASGKLRVMKSLVGIEAFLIQAGAALDRTRDRH